MSKTDDDGLLRNLLSIVPPTICNKSTRSMFGVISSVIICAVFILVVMGLCFAARAEPYTEKWWIGMLSVLVSPLCPLFAILPISMNV